MAFQRDAFQPDALQPGSETKRPIDAFQGDAFQVGAFQVGRGQGGAGMPFVGIFNNPIRRPSYGFTDVAVNLLLTTLAVAAVNVPRDPLYTQQNKGAAPQVIQTVNLLETTLAPVVVGAPFKPSDFPNPSVRKATQQPHPEQGSLPLLEYNVPYYGQDNLWPNPSLSRKVQQDTSVPNLLGTVLAPAPGAAPFKPVDFPNPTVRKVVRQVFDQNPINLLPPTPPVIGTEIQRQPLYTLRLVRTVHQVIDPQNLLPTLLQTVAVAAPFKPVHFPNPVVVKTRQQPHPEQGSLPLLEYSVPYYGQDNQWQNPVWPKKVQQPDIQSTLQLLTFTPPVVGSETLRQPLYTPRFTLYNPAAYHYTLDYFVGLMPPTPIPPVVDSGIPRYIPNPYIVDLPTGKKRTKAERDELRDEFNGVPKKAVKIIKKVALAVIEQPEPNNDDLIAAFERARVSYEAIYAILLQQEIAKQLEIQRKRREDDEFFLLL